MKKPLLLVLLLSLALSACVPGDAGDDDDAPATDDDAYVSLEVYV